jgi:hypothetical protein
MFRPAENIFAFYDGRIAGYRFAEGPNWVDDGALSLGISSYATCERPAAAPAATSHRCIDGSAECVASTRGAVA